MRFDRTMADMGQRMPWSYRLKGMFHQALVDRLGKEAYEAVRPELQDPPRASYLAFRDYPMWDHQRLMVALARVVYRGQPEGEAVRRMARDDIHTLAESTVGSVVLSMIGDARSALLRLPFVYSKMANASWSVTARELDDGRVQLDYEGFHGLWSYQLGQVEGVAAHYGARSEVDVFEDDPPSRYRFEVMLTGGASG